jgi:hypothetical protein
LAGFAVSLLHILQTGHAVPHLDLGFARVVG